jgi:hypothetical protein
MLIHPAKNNLNGREHETISKLQRSLRKSQVASDFNFFKMTDID